jgi:signal transduction histidine kinase
VRRQISRAILGVAVLLVVGLGLPLAVVVQRFYQDRALVELQRRAAETIAEMSLPLEREELASVLHEHDSPGPFSLYTQDGRRLFGSGPATANSLVRRALRGGVVSARSSNDLAVAAPLTDRQNERVAAAVFVTQSARVVDHKVYRAWAVMVAAVTLALLGAAALARRQARRLSAPVAALARQAEDLGRGGFGSNRTVSNIEEIDAVSAALAASGQQLAEILARERTFSADVAHQLRTPLTGLRLQLERAERDRDLTVITAGLAEVVRLQATVEHLLALARDGHPPTATLDVGELLNSLRRRWQDPFTVVGRTLHVSGDQPLPSARGTNVSISQVLDVLVDNGLRHGGGAVYVRARPAAGGLVIEVRDEGNGLSDTFDPFIRRGTGGGIGLGLARSITEAEGGRLLLATAQPACFHVVLPAVEG